MSNKPPQQLAREMAERLARKLNVESIPSEVGWLQKDTETIERELSLTSLLEDKERLDKLQSLTKGYGNGWILRESTNGRGMRLHEHSGSGCNKDVRLAIDNAIKKG